MATAYTHDGITVIATRTQEENKALLLQAALDMAYDTLMPADEWDITHYYEPMSTPHKPTWAQTH